jgi:hypothetical protein
MEVNDQRLRRETKILVYTIIIGLVISGITAFPIYTELAIAQHLIDQFSLNNAFSQWIEVVYRGVNEIDRTYPFIAYGTDWLAFAHLILAVLFVGVLKDPVRNIWIIEFGLIACAGIFPLAFIAGTIRGIPLFWQLIDCSFGLVGGVVLWMCYTRVKKLSVYKNPERAQ